MSKLNILNKEGYLTKEDRKELLERGLEYTTFKTCLDLSKPIEITMYGQRGELTLEQYSRDVASFMAFWTNFVLKDLNGFSGMNSVKFVPTNFKIVQ